MLILKTILLMSPVVVQIPHMHFFLVIQKKTAFLNGPDSTDIVSVQILTHHPQNGLTSAQTFPATIRMTMDTRQTITQKVQSYRGLTAFRLWFRFMIYPEKHMEVQDRPVWEMDRTLSSFLIRTSTIIHIR